MSYNLRKNLFKAYRNTRTALKYIAWSFLILAMAGETEYPIYGMLVFVLSTLTLLLLHITDDDKTEFRTSTGIKIKRIK
jgi:hypothetical protein